MAIKNLISHNQNLNSAKLFINSIQGEDYYLFAGYDLPFANNDTVIPQPVDTTQEILIDSYKNMIFGKHISSDDVKVMIPKNEWVSGTVYAQYDHQDPTLFDKQFYVSVNAASEYHIYKCLFNNEGAPSIQPPTFSDTAANDAFYATSDNYQWKYMYSIDSATYTRFSTSDYIPVVPNANVSGNAVSGAIDVIEVENGGLGYINHCNGTFNSTDIKVNGNPLIYTIVANASSTNSIYNGCLLLITDGTGKGQYREISNYSVVGVSKQVTLNAAFVTVPDSTSSYEITPKVVVVGDDYQTANAEARAIINPVGGNSVIQVEVLTRGKRYFYANCYVYSDPIVGVSSPATLRAILAPKGGHGYDAENELGGTKVGISVQLRNSESNTISYSNDMRAQGILKNPLFNNVVLKTKDSANNVGSNGTFIVGETISQATSNATGIVTSVSAGLITITNASGWFTTGNNSTYTLSGETSLATAQVSNVVNNDSEKGFNTFNQLYRYIGGSLNFGSFSEDETVYQTNINTSNAVLHSAISDGANNVISVTNQTGLFQVGADIVGADSGANMTVASKYDPDLVIGSGEVLYLQKSTPISRSSTQTETIKIILGF